MEQKYRSQENCVYSWMNFPDAMCTHCHLLSLSLSCSETFSNQAPAFKDYWSQFFRKHYLLCLIGFLLLSSKYQESPPTQFLPSVLCFNHLYKPEKLQNYITISFISSRSVFTIDKPKSPLGCLMFVSQTHP